MHVNAMTPVRAVNRLASSLAKSLAVELAASWRMRFDAALMMLAYIVWGLFSRKVVPGIAGNCVGIAAYGAMWYALAVAAGPRTTRWKTAVFALAVCWAIELFQLTPWPLQWAHDGELTGLLSRMALGTGFQLVDVPFYPAGIAIAVALHWGDQWRRARRQGRPLAPILDWVLCGACPKADRARCAESEGIEPSQVVNLATD